MRVPIIILILAPIATFGAGYWIGRKSGCVLFSGTLSGASTPAPKPEVAQAPPSPVWTMETTSPLVNKPVV